MRAHQIMTCWVDPFSGMYLNSEEDDKGLIQRA